MIEDEFGRPVHHLALAPKSDLIVHDDWYFSGCAATGSGSFSVEDLTVPYDFVIAFEAFFSGDQHPGAIHEDSIMRSAILPPSFAVAAGHVTGAAEGMVELPRARLFEHKILGVARIDNALSRARWSEANQLVRVTRLAFDHVVSTVASKGEQEWTAKEIAQLNLDVVTLMKLAKDAVRLLADGIGSSGYALSKPVAAHPSRCQRPRQPCRL